MRKACRNLFIYIFYCFQADGALFLILFNIVPTKNAIVIIYIIELTIIISAVIKIAKNAMEYIKITARNALMDIFCLKGNVYNVIIHG